MTDREVMQMALEQPEQEPVGSLSVRYHLGSKSMTNADFDYNGDLPEGDYELYTTPTAAQRKPLTHEQAKALVAKYSDDPLNLVFQTEAAHGIKEIK